MGSGFVGKLESLRSPIQAVSMPKAKAWVPKPAISLVRLALPAQPIDATPSNPLIGQHFPLRIGPYGKTQSEPKQGSVLFDSTLANETSLIDS
jgi:hypothetical protein